MDQRVTIHIDAGVADVRLARPDKMNAMDPAMNAALVAAGERLKTEPSVRAIVLSGEGRAFCAGLDSGRFGDMAEGGFADDLSAHGHGGANLPQQAVMVWRETPAPVIAAVHGFALGAGLQIALGADIRIVAPDAQLSVMEIRWGLVPDMGGTVLLERLVREDVARELTYTGRVVSGEEAVRLGLATRVADDPRAAALDLARDIAGKSPDAIRAAKRLFNGLRGASQADALAAEARAQTALIGGPNQVEAVRANLEKRAPRFTD